MILLLSSLVALLVGAIVSILLMRSPRLGLLAAMSAIVVSSVLSILAVALVLLGVDAAPAAVHSSMPLGTATLGMDGLSAWFVLTIALLSAAVAIYSPSYLKEEMGHVPVPMFSALMCMLVGSLYLVVCAGDVVLFLVSWEVMTLSGFFLVGFHDRSPEVRRGAWMYLIATHIATAAFVLPMFAILVARSGGSTSFSAIGGAMAGADGRMLMLVFLLGLVGFGTKAGFMPMHVWLPNAHPVAPTPVSAFLSGVVIKTGIYGVLRLLSWLPPLPASCGMVMLAVGTASGVLGVLYAIAQHDLKRLLAYHSVENIGIIALGIGMGMLGRSMYQQSVARGDPRAIYEAIAVVGYAGAMMHVLNHALFKSLLFLSAGAVIHSTGTGEIDRLGGLARRTPVNAALFVIAAVSICGLPPFNGFVSEWLIYGSLFRGASSLGGSAALWSVLGLTGLALMGGLALACFSKVIGVVFLGEARDSTVKAHGTPGAMQGSMAMLAALCVAIGILPGLVLPLTAPGVAVLSHTATSSLAGSLRASLSPAWTISGMALVLAAVAGLLVFVRSRTAAVAAVPPVPTWGCGFPQPTARMQYTASSFAWSLVSSFRAALWTQSHVHGPKGPFPAESSLETHTPDIAETDVFAPLFGVVARISRMIKTVSWSGEGGTGLVDSEGAQERIGPMRLMLMHGVSAMRRGSVHICLTYIVIALLVVFVIEAVSFEKPAARPAKPASPQAIVSDAGRMIP